MRFQSEDGGIHYVKTSGVASLSFMDDEYDHDVFVCYTGGDCDVFLPYVSL